MRSITDIEDVILFLRYHNVSPETPTKTYMTYKNIAQHFSRSITYVQNICYKPIAISKSSKVIPYLMTRRQKRDKNHLLKIKHRWFRKEIDFIKSQETLDLMVGMSLSDRCEVLKLQMPDTYITIYKLRKLYRE